MSTTFDLKEALRDQLLRVLNKLEMSQDTEETRVLNEQVLLLCDRLDSISEVK